jgi:hypothetical protein
MGEGVPQAAWAGTRTWRWIVNGRSTLVGSTRLRWGPHLPMTVSLPFSPSMSSSWLLTNQPKNGGITTSRDVGENRPSGRLLEAVLRWESRCDTARITARDGVGRSDDCLFDRVRCIAFRWKSFITNAWCWKFVRCEEILELSNPAEENRRSGSPPLLLVLPFTKGELEGVVLGRKEPHPTSPW